MRTTSMNAFSLPIMSRRTLLFSSPPSSSCVRVRVGVRVRVRVGVRVRVRVRVSERVYLGPRLVSQENAAPRQPVGAPG